MSKLTLLATGDVIAGLDLSQMKPADAWREGDGTLVLRLPPPQILVTRLDNSQSRVLTRNTGILRRADINLESRAREHAETGIRNEAIRRRHPRPGRRRTAKGSSPISCTPWERRGCGSSRLFRRRRGNG